MWTNAFDNWIGFYVLRLCTFSVQKLVLPWKESHMKTLLVVSTERDLSSRPLESQRKRALIWKERERKGKGNPFHSLKFLVILRKYSDPKVHTNRFWMPLGSTFFPLISVVLWQKGKAGAVWKKLFSAIAILRGRALQASPAELKWKGCPSWEEETKRQFPS